MMCANTKFSLFFFVRGSNPPGRTPGAGILTFRCFFFVRAHPGCRNTDFSMVFFCPGLDSPLCAGMAVGYFSWPACDGRES